MKELYIEKLKNTTLKNKDYIEIIKAAVFLKKRKTGMHLFVKFILPITICATLLSGCGIYSFRDAVIPDKIKTVKIGFIESRNFKS